MSEVIEAGVRYVIQQAEQAKIEKMYDGLFTLKGTGKAGIKDTSTTIDEELYGEDGAWKGIRE